MAGYDLVFTPVKSVSLLMALAGPEVRARSRQPTTRQSPPPSRGSKSMRRSPGPGTVAPRRSTPPATYAPPFDHRESRSGEPDLHTHVAVANKVQGVDGKWRSLDARGLHALGVAASER